MHLYYLHTDGTPPGLKSGNEINGTHDSVSDLDTLTDAELDREIKKHQIRNLRSETRRNESQARLYDKTDRKFAQLLSLLIKGGIDTKKELVAIKQLLAGDHANEDDDDLV